MQVCERDFAACEGLCPPARPSPPAPAGRYSVAAWSEEEGADPLEGLQIVGMSATLPNVEDVARRAGRLCCNSAGPAGGRGGLVHRGGRVAGGKGRPETRWSPFPLGGAGAGALRGSPKPASPAVQAPLLSPGCTRRTKQHSRPPCNTQLEAACRWLGAEAFKTDFRPVPLRQYLKVVSSTYITL